MEIAGVLIHCFKDQITPAIAESLLPHFAETLTNLNGKSDYEVLNAVCFLCDVLEYGSEDIFSKVAEKAVEKFMESMKVFQEDRGIIQSAAYGLGVIAKRTPKGQLPMINQILTVNTLSNLYRYVQVLSAIIQESDSRTNEDKAQSTENCIGAIGKLVYFHFDGQTINNAVTLGFL